MSATDILPLQHIHDLAANYSDRQGLRIVPMGIAMMALAWPRPIPTSIFGVDTQFAALAIGFAGYWLLGRYYEHRFGRVEEIPYQGISIAAQSSMVVAAFMIAGLIDVVVHPPIFVSGLVIAAWLTIAAWPSRRIRGDYFAAGIVLALVSLEPLVGESHAEVARTYGFLFGMGLFIAGMRDHSSFLRSFPAVKGDDE